ncbi:UNVERIFIED_CONTAM: hypothetical protein FKN15_002447 [Acipenser sinensis]
MAKYGTEGVRGGVRRGNSLEMGGSRKVETAIDEYKSFELDASGNREPVEGAGQQSSVGEMRKG